MTRPGSRASTYTPAGARRCPGSARAMRRGVAGTGQGIVAAGVRGVSAPVGGNIHPGDRQQPRPGSDDRDVDARAPVISSLPLSRKILSTR